MNRTGLMALQRHALASLIVVAGMWMAAQAQSADPLPSWNDGASKQAIVALVEAVTTEGGVDFVPPEERRWRGRVHAALDRGGLRHPTRAGGRLDEMQDGEPVLMRLAKREYADDRKSHIGTLDKALDAAGPAGWIVVSMKDDWKVVFPQ